jgi:hypothetical protein
MTREEVEKVIYKLLSLRHEITRLGGAEEAPLLWAKCVKLHSIVLKHFNLPSTYKNTRLLEMPKLSNVYSTDELRQTVSFGFDDDFQKEFHKKEIVREVYEKLILKAEQWQKSKPKNPLEFLFYGKGNEIPANDLLQMLGYINEPYFCFLISEIWYKGFGTADQVLGDLKLCNDANIWAYIEYASDFLWEQQMGIDKLKRSGLRFIEEFLLWEREFVIQIDNK